MKQYEEMIKVADPMFELAPRLKQDTICLGDFTLCQARLMNDARFVWVILVPQVANITEAFQLCEQDQEQLMYESNKVSRCLSEHFGATSMNVAALGNVVSQLHLHHVVRFDDDVCWPTPVWGQGEAVAYGAKALSERTKTLQTLFRDLWSQA